MKTLQETLNDLAAKKKAFFDDAFTNPVKKTPYDIPPELRKLSERLCHAYGINGVCDPMYIANVIAFELGLGDGCSNFNHEKFKNLLAK